MITDSLHCHANIHKFISWYSIFFSNWFWTWTPLVCGYWIILKLSFVDSERLIRAFDRDNVRVTCLVRNFRRVSGFELAISLVFSFFLSRFKFGLWLSNKLEKELLLFYCFIMNKQTCNGFKLQVVYSRCEKNLITLM